MAGRSAEVRPARLPDLLGLWHDDIWCWRHPGARGERRSCKQTHVWRERTVKKMLNNPSLVLSEAENWLPGKRVSLWPPLISRTIVANGDVTVYRGKIGMQITVRRWCLHYPHTENHGIRRQHAASCMLCPHSWWQPTTALFKCVHSSEICLFEL